MHMSKEPATHSLEGDFLKVIPTHLYIHRSTYTPRFKRRAQHTHPLDSSWPQLSGSLYYSCLKDPESVLLLMGMFRGQVGEMAGERHWLGVKMPCSQGDQLKTWAP